MNGRYLYRAKRTDCWGWEEGYLIYDKMDGQYRIVINLHDSTGTFIYSENAPRVDINTICRCTGKNDVDGKLIFEHDIVTFLDAYSTENGQSEQSCLGEVCWDDKTLSFQVTGRLSAESYEVLEECKVIGNIFDNPELLEVENERNNI